MNILNTMKITASGLSAERLRMDTISSNLANVETTRSSNGEPYKRKIAVFKEVYDNEKNIAGVKVDSIKEDDSEYKMEYDPTHPDADENGYVKMPNINILNEMADMMISVRTYEANIDVLDATKNMYAKALEIGN